MRHAIFQPSSIPVFHSCQGFTLIEVVVALGIAMVLVCAVAYSLMTTLQVEDTIGWLQEGSLAVNTVSCNRQLGVPEKEMNQGLGEMWEVTYKDLEPKDETNLAWRTWTLSPKSRPSLAAEISFELAD